MSQNIIDLTKQLISIPSTKDDAPALIEVLARALKPLADFTIEHFDKDGAPSALVHNQKTGHRNFKVILNAHLDVVPALESQYHPQEKNGKLYGRGTSDMKGAAAVEILTFAELAQKLNYPLALQLVTDEEIGGFNCAKYQIDEGVRADFVIAGEPTDLGINNMAKGIVWAKIVTSGSTGHGAYPWQGKNAIWIMHKILTKIYKQYKEPTKEVWQTTVNLANIETSNKTTNKIPSDCIAILDIRYIPEESDTILSALEEIVGKEAKLEVLLKEPAQFTNSQNEFVKRLGIAFQSITNNPPKTIVKHGGSDIRHFNAAGCPGVTFGPVGQGLHTDEEWVDITSLQTYQKVLKSFLLSLD